jgi:alginate O-acetyltransferase complex protein AlgJ
LNNARERDEFLPHYAAILSAAGVNVVDTATLTATLVNRGIAAFPRGGAHWNSLVAADATQELIGKLNQLSPFLQIPLLAWRSYTSSKPRDSDRDLVDLLNLLRGWSDEVPELEFASSNSCERKVNATIVGGSFMPIIAEMLTKTGCVERVDLYFYLHVSLVRSPGMQVLKRDLKSADIVVIKEAPVIILEENELVMPRSDHGLAFYNLIFRGPK